MRKTPGSKRVHPNSAAAREWGRESWSTDDLFDKPVTDEKLHSPAESRRWKPKRDDLLAAATTPELEKLVSEQLYDDGRKLDPVSGTYFDVRPQRKGPRGGQEYVLSLNSFESHDGLTPADNDERHDEGAKYGVPRGNVPVDIGGERTAPASFDCEVRNVARVHHRLSESPEERWNRIAYQGVLDLLEILGFQIVSEHDGSRWAGKVRRVREPSFRWFKGWADRIAYHPNLDSNQGEGIGLLVDVVTAVGKFTIAERQKTGEAIRVLAERFGYSKSSLHRLIQDDHKNGEPMTALELIDRFEAALDKNTAVQREQLVELRAIRGLLEGDGIGVREQRQLVREVEQYLAEVS